MSRGVYIIKNLYNGFVYIGSSSNMELRIDSHRVELRNGWHYNKPMQKDYNKYKKYFLWGVYKEMPFNTREEIYLVEQELLDKISDKYNILINATDHLRAFKKRERERQLKLNL